MELRLSTAEKFKLSALPMYKGLPEAEDPAYPLVLTSAKSRYYLHSSYRWVEKLRKMNPDPRLEIHPETARSSGSPRATTFTHRDPLREDHPEGLFLRRPGPARSLLRPRLVVPRG